MFERDLTHCPRCGERVTAFAAGCAYCGAELDISRFRKRRAAGGSTGGHAVAPNPVDAVRGWVRRAAGR
jgi:hypothetical protein